jgi:hypothetical protein
MVNNWEYKFVVRMVIYVGEEWSDGHELKE